MVKSTKVLNFSILDLPSDEIYVLLMGLSFTPTPLKPDIHELERDIFKFTRKLRLAYHFRDSDFQDNSVVKSNSAFCPKRNANQELEYICSTLEKTKVRIVKTKDNTES